MIPSLPRGRRAGTACPVTQEQSLGSDGWKPSLPLPSGCHLSSTCTSFSAGAGSCDRGSSERHVLSIIAVRGSDVSQEGGDEAVLGVG